MKRVLFITESCFPVIGAENIVNARLLAVLTNSGNFQIDVITKKKKWQNYPSDSLDEYGIKLNSLNLLEVDNKVNLTTIWQHLLSLFKFGVVHKGDHWAYKAVFVAMNLIKSNEYDYVLTRAQPSHLVGFYLKKKYGINWVCTWNDPYPSEMYPLPFGKGINSVMRLKYHKSINIMRQADVFVYPNKRLADYINSFLKSPEESIRIIPHVMMQKPKQARNKIGNQVKLIHSGDCTGTRSAKKTIQAIKELKDNNLLCSQDFQLTFLGRINEKDKEYVKCSGIDDIVSVMEPVSYLNSLKILDSFDVAVIIEAPWNEGVFLPTKVSDFMMEGKRIFAISPENGHLHDLYNEGFLSYYANTENVDSIKNEILKLLKDYKEDNWNDYNVIVPQQYFSDFAISQYSSL